MLVDAPPVPVIVSLVLPAVLTVVSGPSRNTPMFELAVPAPPVPVMVTAPVPLEVTFAPL